MAVADDYFAFIIEADPGVQPGDFIVGHYDLATGGVAADGQTLRDDGKGAAGEESRRGH
jgi:hypothetical protein